MRWTNRTVKQRCVSCKKPIDTPGAVWSGERGPFCPPCYNESVATQVGLSFDNARLEPVTMEDHVGQRHTFQVVSHLLATGHSMEAVELGEDEGYRFSVIGDFEEDALVLCARLCEAIRAGLARRSLEPTPDGDEVLAERVVARIASAPGCGEPLIVIDGRAFTWEEFGQMLLCYEGWTVEMAFHDGTEVVSGPRGLHSEA